MQVTNLKNHKMPVLDAKSKQLYSMVNQILTEGEVSTRFVIMLKEKDPQDNGYLNKKMIDQTI